MTLKLIRWWFVVENSGGKQMNNNSNLITKNEKGVLPFIDGYDMELAAYLTSKWQESFDQLSDTLYNATIVLYLFAKDGYKVALTNDRVSNPFANGQLRKTQGTDFIDLIRANGRMLLIEDAEEDIHLKDSQELKLGFFNMMGKPIVNRDDLMIGELVVLREDTMPIENSDIKLMTWLSTSIEESIKNFELEGIINKVKVHDHLTQLITRDKMMQMIVDEFERSQRSSMPFSLVVIDIDNFKGINEVFGHEQGDMVLKQFANLILDRIRQIDFACRWDGDAFALLLPQTEMIGANQLVSDLFFNLTHHIFPEIGRCYFSMGLADFSEKDKGINDMLLRLDKALYRVKAFGGNSHVARYHK